MKYDIHLDSFTLLFGVWFIFFNVTLGGLSIYYIYYNLGYSPVNWLSTSWYLIQDFKLTNSEKKKD